MKRRRNFRISWGHACLSVPSDLSFEYGSGLTVVCYPTSETTISKQNRHCSVDFSSLLRRRSDLLYEYGANTLMLMTVSS